MAAPETLACWTATTQDEQNYWIYVAAGGTEMSLACFAATTADEQTWLIFQQLGGGGGGGQVVWVPEPANETDFTVLPGGVAPTGDQVYLANRDNFTFWKISAANSEWVVVNTDSIP